MKMLILALGISFGATAFACDCQKNQPEQQAKCTCGGGQSCPGECNHADPSRESKPEKKKKKS